MHPGIGMWSPSRVFNIRRRETRYACSVPVKVQRFLQFGPEVTRGVTLDLSSCGMSALVCGAPRVGETVVIELPWHGLAVELLATVRHSTQAKSGFEFFPLSPNAQQGIQEWIAELEMEECGLFPHIRPGTPASG